MPHQAISLARREAKLRPEVSESIVRSSVYAPKRWSILGNLQLMSLKAASVCHRFRPHRWLWWLSINLSQGLLTSVPFTLHYRCHVIPSRCHTILESFILLTRGQAAKMSHPSSLFLHSQSGKVLQGKCSWYSTGYKSPQESGSSGQARWTKGTQPRQII